MVHWQSQRGWEGGFAKSWEGGFAPDSGGREGGTADWPGGAWERVAGSRNVVFATKAWSGLRPIARWETSFDKAGGGAAQDHLIRSLDERIGLMHAWETMMMSINLQFSAAGNELAGIIRVQTVDDSLAHEGAEGFRDFR